MSSSFERSNDIYENYVCPHCFNTMDKCTCDVYPSYSIVWIDKGIQEHVRILNNKGYRTAYSCESHDKNDTVYIKLHNYCNIGESAEMPEGFKFNKRNNTIEHRYDKNMSATEFENSKSKALNVLLEWCKSLPEYSK